MKIRLWLCSFVLATATAVASAGAQQSAEVIRGKVTGPDSLPVPHVYVTAVSFQGGITKTATTDKNGLFTIVYPNGEGDYLLSFLAVGFTPRKFEVKRQADEAILIANTRLAVATLAPVQVQAQGAKQPPNRNAGVGDIAGSERSILNALISADQAGNLAAMAAAIPGIQLIPGIDGNPDAFSALGLDPSQNSTTLNGVPSNLLGIPTDAGLGASVRTGASDVSVGGFSGGQISLTIPSGTNYSVRRASGIFNTPQLDVTDRVGQPGLTTQLSQSGYASGPITMDKSFYYGSYSLARRLNDEQDLFSTGTDVLQSAGVSRDSAQRLSQALQALGIPRSVGSVPGSRTNDNATIITSFDIAPKAAISGASYKISATGSYSGTDPASNNMNAAPSFLYTNRNLNGSLQVRHTDYFGSGIFAGTLTQSSLAATMTTNTVDPYLQLPTGNVRVLSALDDGTITSRQLLFGGNSSAQSSSTTKSFIFQNQLLWVSPNNKHTVKVISELHDDISESTVPPSLGTFSYQSIADVEAGLPSSYTRSLSPRDNGAKDVLGAVGINDSWIPKPGVFQMQYGVRFDGNHYYDGPANNPAVEQTFGIANNHVPNKIYASPRLGFSWTYGTGTQIPLGDFFITGPRARLYGGINMLQNVAGAGLISGARASTGLPGSALSLSCVGAATPIPNWNEYLANPNSAPTQCADGTGGTVFASTVPGVTMFDPNYVQSRSVNSTLGWTGAIMDNRFTMSVVGQYSLQLNQPGTIDLNFRPTQQFSLSEEGGRPVYVLPTSIVPTTGLIASRDARVSQDFGRVSYNQSNLMAEARQVQFNLSPLNYNPTRFSWSVGYTYLNRIDQYNGFSSTAGNPLDRAWGTSAGPQHNFTYSMSYNFGGAITVIYGGALQSGQRFTPTVDRDVNGDGSANDRAFVFDPAHTADPAVAAGIQSLLNSKSSSIRDCLRRQIGELAGRNSCTSPWVFGNQTLSVRFTPGHIWLPPRTTLNFSISNPLSGLDLLMHGENGMRGWGQRVNPDQQLLYVRGFDAVSQRYIYQVNERFGSTSLQQTTQRAPAILSLTLSYDLAPPRDWQNFRTALDRGRGRPGTKLPEASLKSYSSALVVNPMARIMQTADVLKLSRKQADSIAKLSRLFSDFVDSLWAPTAKYMAELPNSYDRGLVESRYIDARMAAIDYLIKIVPKVSSLLSRGQKRTMSQSVAQYLEPRYLEYLRTGALGGG